MAAAILSICSVSMGGDVSVIGVGDGSCCSGATMSLMFWKMVSDILLSETRISLMSFSMPSFLRIFVAMNSACFSHVVSIPFRLDFSMRDFLNLEEEEPGEEEEEDE